MVIRLNMVCLFENPSYISRAMRVGLIYCDHLLFPEESPELVQKQISEF